MESCKLQLGCLLIVLYLTFIYYKERRRFGQKERFSLYDGVLITGICCLLLDGITAYTVNHQELIPAALNLILHGMFLVSIDALIFMMFLYILHTTKGMPLKISGRLLLCAPFLVNALLVFCNLHSLEYRRGKMGYYSMGISAYTCFVMAGIYLLLTIAIVFRRFNHIESHKRINIITCLLTIFCVTGYQMMVPDSLITSIGTTLLLVGAYVNQENPAIRELNRYHDEMVMGFATLIENRDDSTGAHIKRTTRYVRLIADELRRRGCFTDTLTEDYVQNLLAAAPMHDVGKIAVPDAILQKPGRLTAEEFEQMKQHTVKGGAIIDQTFSRMGNDQFLEIAHQIALYHHEKYNGKGYPKGLKRKEIPLCARIMAIADVFDAVSEDRCYRKALPLDTCFEIILEGSGQDFDPIIAEAFLDMREEVSRIRAGEK